MRNDEKGRTSKRGNEEIMNKSKWKMKKNK